MCVCFRNSSNTDLNAMFQIRHNAGHMMSAPHWGTFHVQEFLQYGPESLHEGAHGQNRLQRIHFDVSRSRHPTHGRKCPAQFFNVSCTSCEVLRVVCERPSRFIQDLSSEGDRKARLAEVLGLQCRSLLLQVGGAVGMLGWRPRVFASGLDADRTDTKTREPCTSTTSAAHVPAPEKNQVSRRFGLVFLLVDRNTFFSHTRLVCAHHTFQCRQST